MPIDPFEIKATKLSKRYNREWIYRQLDLSFHSGATYAITGPNGSGKSTLLKTLSGFIPATSGQLQYTQANQILDEEDYYKKISIVTPELELIEEFTLVEAVKFHLSFSDQTTYNVDQIIEDSYLENARNKILKHFSSGMKQRLKLALAFFSEKPILFLDEPTSNLDIKGKKWYEIQLDKAKDRLVVISSNLPQEYEQATQILEIINYK